MLGFDFDPETAFVVELYNRAANGPIENVLAVVALATLWAALEVLGKRKAIDAWFAKLARRKA